ncbi:hypothetical protein EDD80_10372 [Anseongella ginsenosidimutans]|uniref:YhhN-like protein n=1 Tax=Anseongella ginsenosidimutans TaxID=496056 RepID=A0A4R3KTD8_9SPHI|nr:hypothetical protein EDD80_10372 [Anseongella ginsenosidimutans]
MLLSLEPDILNIFRKISLFGALIPFSISLLRFRQIPRRFKLIIVFTLISTIGELTATVLVLLRTGNTLPGLHIYTLAEGVILLLFYSQLLLKKIRPAFFWITIVFFSLFTILNSIFLQSIFEINSNARTVEALLILGCAILFYFHLLESEETESIKRSLLWINNAIFLYFSVSLLFFISGSYVLTNYPMSVSKLIWDMHKVFHLIFQIILARGIWLLGKKAAF